MKKQESLKKTALQDNFAFVAIDEYNTKTKIIPLLLDKNTRKKILDEHKNNPFGISGDKEHPTKVYSAELARIIDKLRVQPTNGKLALYQPNCNGPFHIVELPGKRGGKIRELGMIYEDRAEAEHVIFKKRIITLLAQYGFELAETEC